MSPDIVNVVRCRLARWVGYVDSLEIREGAVKYSGHVMRITGHKDLCMYLGDKL